jgi:spore coat protein A
MVLRRLRARVMFETESNRGLLVEWTNRLPPEHFLSIDYSLHGAGRDAPEVRSVVHLHGGSTPPESDGYPEDWYLPGQSRTYYYPNRQEPALLFYHDHAMGITRLNMYAGLMGLHVVRDRAERDLQLPNGRHEVPLVLFDRHLRVDGQLDYPVSNDPEHPWYRGPSDRLRSGPTALARHHHAPAAGPSRTR